MSKHLTLLLGLVWGVLYGELYASPSTAGLGETLTLEKSLKEKKVMKNTYLDRIDSAAKEVLIFWFGEPTSAEYGKSRNFWFQKSLAVDEEICRRFTGLHQRAQRGELDSWRNQPETLLSLIIVLDQFSRHLHRQSAAAFANDPKALTLAIEGIKRDFDQAVMPVARAFYYLPLEHSEDLGHQEKAVALFSKLYEEDNAYGLFLEYAKKHYEVIAQFGRFPHRNELLGRQSSAGEKHYLSQPGSGF